MLTQLGKAITDLELGSIQDMVLGAGRERRGEVGYGGVNGGCDEL